MPLTVSCFSKIYIGFTFLVPGSPGQRIVKRVCVCVCVLARVLAIAQCLSVCVFVCLSVTSRCSVEVVGQIELVFWHGCFRPVLHCVLGKYRHLQK